MSNACATSSSGPGQCLCHELVGAGVPFQRQVVVPVSYRGVIVGDGFKADIVVDRQLILEIKAVATILPAHEAQLYTDLRMSGLRIGLLLNFNAPRLVDGLRRRVL
jgi:GxxExxY protein